MKYPNSSKDYVKPLISASNRGMSLEDDINRTNRYYLTEDTAVIHKKPTPITIVKVDYPKRSAARITEAYFRVASTTDYNGIYLGKYIDFEAKECESATSFPFSSSSVRVTCPLTVFWFGLLNLMNTVPIPPASEPSVYTKISSPKS